MIVPEYWAEARVRDRIDGSQVTIKRFGWSDESEAAAQAHARQRAEDAIARARAGETVRRVDHKLAYNGAEGLPIREEVVSRHGETVITRNVYGALCLNTPNVLFADIDFPTEPPTRVTVLFCLGFLLLAALIGFGTGSGWLFIAIAGGGLMMSGSLASWLVRRQERRQGGADAIVRRTIEGCVRDHPEAHFRVYRTPMGYRVLAMHKTFDPTSDEARQLLSRLDSDPMYQRMCRNQHCFRARVSPKPWRIGMDRIGPRPGVWPIRAERVPARLDWIRRYTEVAPDYAACRFEGRYGSPTVDPAAESVRELHDQLSRADTRLPIA